MNEFQKTELLQELKDLEDTLICYRLMAIKRIKNGDIAGADEMLADAVRTIEQIRDRFFI